MSEWAVELCEVSKLFPGREGESGTAAVQRVSLHLRAGEFFTLLGPSGCGKTTTLRMIAGFEQPTSGEIRVMGRSMHLVPPYRRPVNLVFQDYALFPHMTVAQNVGFALQIRGVPRRERERAVAEALELVRLPEVGGRKPKQLSGGQQQRVALARALINRPAVLLLDEPLGALDLKLRKAMQLELKQLQAQVGCTFLYVTHDQEEALIMSDRVAVMRQGEVLQVADPSTIYERPASRFVADFIGETNFLPGEVVGVQDGSVTLLACGHRMKAVFVNGQARKGARVTLAVRPEKIKLSPNGTLRSGYLPGEAVEVTYLGTDTLYQVALRAGARLVVRVQNGGGRGLRQFRRGEAVQLHWDSQDALALME
jgi:spermidine/putrescine transport system ATP-binding protein